MAINFIKKEDLSHITRTTRQWETTIDRYEIIPKGVLCIELCNDKLTKIKIGNGHLIYEQLPYVSDVNLSDYYTKEETNNLIKDLKAIKIKGEASSLSDLPLRGNEEGDLWFIPKQDPDTHNRYDEYVWYNNKWESFGSSDIDLSEYAKKSYVDTHIQEVQNEITEIIESGYLHKHSNKDILDQTSAVYNVEKDNKLRDLHNYDDTELREKAHTHLNKNILDQTDAVYNRDKDDKLSSLHNYDDTDIQDRISTLESVAHSHDNQDILNRTTAAFTKEQALQLLDCKDFEGTDGVHDGYHGFVPAPTKDDIGKVLGANGQWVEGGGGGGGGDTIAQGGGIEITTDAQTGVKTVSVNAGTGLDIDQQTGELYVTSTGGDSIAEGNGIDITTDSQTGVKIISVDIGNGLQFNQNSEIDINTGDGLQINQDNELNVNTGEGLSINNNNAIELDKATTTTIGGVIVGDNIDVNNGTISVPKAASNKLGVIKPSDGLSVDSNGVLTVDTGDGLSIDSTTKEVNVNVGRALSINNNNEIDVDIASRSAYGVVKVGEGVNVDSNGIISVEAAPPFRTGDGIILTDESERLPSGFTKIEYVESSSTNVAYTSINYYVNANSKFIGRMSKTEPTTDSYGNSPGTVFGTIGYTRYMFGFVNDQGSTLPLYCGIQCGDGTSPDPWYNNKSSLITSFVLNDIVNFEASVADGLKLNNELHQTYQVYGGTLPVGRKLGVMAADANGISSLSAFYGRLYFLKIYEGNVLKISLVPCIQTSSSTPGLYDTVAGTFYASTSGNPFLYDPETIDVEVPDWVLKADIATSSKLGSVKVGSGLSAANDGTLSVDIGDGLSINQDNELEVSTGRALSINVDNEIDVDIASDSSYGCVKIGEGIDVDQYGIISVDKMSPFRAGNGLELVDESVRLPSAYARVEYVENTVGGGWALINSLVPRYVGTSSDKSHIIARLSKTAYSSSSTITYAFGRWDNYNTRVKFAFGYHGTSLPLTVGYVYGRDASWNNVDVNGGRVTNYELNDIIDVDLSAAGLKIDNELIHTVTYEGPGAIELKFGVFRPNTSGTPESGGVADFRGRIYSLKLYDDQVLIFNLVPCVQKSSSIVGFYDSVGDTFYPSVGDNPFETDMSTMDIDVADWVMNVTPATTDTIGGIKVGEGLSVDNTGELSVNVGDGLFVDSTNNDVNVKIGQALSINNSNEIDVNLGQALSINNNNEIDVDIATATSLGVVKAGSGLNIDEFGNLSTQATPFRIGRALSLDDESVRLPSAYAKAKYVANPSSAAVRINFRPSDYPNAKYVSSVSLDSCGSSSSYPTRYLCGASGWTGSLQIPLDGTSGGLPIKTFFYIGNGNNPEYTSTAFQFGDRFDIEASVLGGYKINNELVQASATPPSNFGTYYLAIFGSGASNGPGEPGFIGKMYYFRIYNSDDTLLCNLVPAVRRTDNVVGFYDMVGNQFYPSETSTAFTTDMDDLDVDDPDWVLNANIATSNSLGVVKPSTGLVVNEHGALSVNTGDGLTVNQDNELEVNTGNGLQINQDGELEIDPSIIPDVPQYYSGKAINITASAGSNLPTGYAEVDYIEALGDSYTIIDYIPNRNTKIIGTAMMIEASTDPVVFGARTGSNGQQFVFWFNSYSSTQATVGFVYGTNTWNTTTDADGGKLISYVMGDQFTFLLSLEDEFNVNGEFVHNITENGAPASNIKLGIFALTISDTSIESSGTIFKGRIYEFKIYENDELIVNLVPALYISTGSVGFYDTIGDTFYTSRTSTPFICDPSTAHVSGYLVDVKYGNGLTLNQNNELEVVGGGGGTEYRPGKAIEFEHISSHLILTDFSNTDFIASITSANAGSFVKAADNSTITLTATGTDCYTKGIGGDGSASGSYAYNVKAETQYRLMWDSSDKTVPGRIMVFENAGYTNVYVGDQSVTSFIDFTTSSTCTYITTRLGITNTGDSVTFSNVRLYEYIEDTLEYDEISVKYDNGLTVNSNNELEVVLSNGLEFDPNAIETMVADEMYLFASNVSCQVHTDNPSYSIPTDRTYQKTTTEPALCCIWEVGDSGSLWTGPLIVGLTQTSVQYTAQDTQQTVTYQNTFTYLDKTWYTSGYPDFLNNADHEDKLGNLQYLGSYAAVTDQIQAAKDLIDLANVQFVSNAGIQVKLGNGLQFDSNDDIEVNTGDGLSVNQDNELEVVPATSSTIGGVIVGNGLTVTSDGTISTATGKAYIAGEGINMSSSPYEFSAENEQYLFRSQVTCELHGSFNREFQKTTDDTALGIIWNVYDSGTLWSGPVFVGLSSDSVKYTTNSTTYSALGTFSYLGKTWYYSDTQMYVSNIDGIDYDGNMVVDTETYASVSELVDFCKSLIDRAHVILKVDEISLLPATEDTLGGIKIGEGLSINENNVVSSTVYEEGQGITFETTESGDGFNVKNKEYYFDDIVSCQLNGDYGPRTFTRVSTDPCLLAIAQAPSNGTIWACPLAVGLTENSVKYSNSYDGITVGPDDSFEYRGYTWYITWNYGLMNSSGVDLMGNVPSIDTTSIDISDRNNLYLLGQALIDAAELIQTIITMDVWGDGTGWLNGDYYGSTSDTFATDWYYTYHYDPTEYIPVPEGALKVRVIGISNENDSHFEGGGVNAFDSNHHHTHWIGCCTATDEWVDIPEGVVYVQPNVKWNNNDTRTISASDIKSVTLQFWFSDPKNNAITAKLGNGLEFDQDDAIQVKLGDGLIFDEDNQVAFDESILPADPPVYTPGVAISFVDNQNPYVTKVRWTVSEIRGGVGDSWIQLRYFGFYDSNQNRIPILSGIGAWEDGSTVSYYQHRTLNNMIANSYEMTASTWTGSNPFIMTFDLPSGTRLKDLKYFRYQTGDDENYRDPVSWTIHAYDEELDRWLLIDTETSATVPTNRNDWTSYFNLAYDSSSPSSSDIPIYDINVKYGDGLTINQNNELTLDTSIQLIIHCVPDPES